MTSFSSRDINILIRAVIYTIGYNSAWYYLRYKCNNKMYSNTILFRELKFIRNESKGTCLSKHKFCRNNTVCACISFTNGPTKNGFGEYSKDISTIIVMKYIKVSCYVLLSFYANFHLSLIHI